jgi:hypothetical protein
MLAAMLAAMPAAASEPLPIPSIDFDVQYDIRLEEPAVLARGFVRHAGGWYRADVIAKAGENASARVTSFNREGYEGVILFAEFAGERAAFRVADITGMDPVHDSWRKKSGTRLGEMTVVGERCVVWQPDAGVPPDKRVDACVTADGILLHAARPGTSQPPLMRAIRVHRLPQDAGWFAMPQGVKLRDVADKAALEREIDAWKASVLNKSRQKPPARRAER